MSDVFERHVSEADTRKAITEPSVYERRECVADGNCERPAVHFGMCRFHHLQELA